MDATDVLAQIANLVNAWPSNSKQRGLFAARYDGDHKSGEIVLVTESPAGGHQEWIISSTHVKKAEDAEADRNTDDKRYSDIARDGRLD